MLKLATIIVWFCVVIQILIMLALGARELGGIGLGIGNFISYDSRSGYLLVAIGAFVFLLILLWNFRTKKILMLKMAKIIGWLCVVIQIPVMLVLAARANGGLGLGGGNHVGYDIRNGYWLASVGAFVFLLILLLSGKLKVVSVVVLVSSILLAMEIFLFDHFNVIVEYNLWLDRGMP